MATVPGATQPAAPVQVRKPPQGVEKTLKLNISTAMGIPRNVASPPTEVQMQQVDMFFSDPTQQHVGFKLAPALLSFPAYALPLYLMTRKKKPIAAFYMFDDGDTTKDSGVVVLALRGNRKLSDTCFVEVDDEHMEAVKQSVFVVHPSAPCNFHPWYSSILSSFSDKCELNVVYGDHVKTGVRNAIEKNRIIIALVLPCSVEVELVYHNLAIDAAPAAMTDTKRKEHEDMWLSTEVCVQTNPKKQHYMSMFNLFNDITRQLKVFAPCDPKLAAIAKSGATKAADSKSTPAIKDGDNDDTVDAVSSKQQKKSVDVQVSVPATAKAGEAKDASCKKAAKPNKDEGNSRHKRKVESNFIADAAESPGVATKDEDREEVAEHEFLKTLEKYNDTDNSSSDSDSVEKRKKRRRKQISDSESEMSDDYSDDDDEDSDENSDEDGASSSEEESATPSEQEQPAPKKKRLVKSSDVEKGTEVTQTTRPLAPGAAGITKAHTGPPATEERNFTIEPLTFCEIDSIETKKKSMLRNAPARENREGVAANINLMLDAVEGSVAIPLSMTENIDSLVTELRDGFKAYELEKFPIKKTYKLHNQHAKLTMALHRVATANMTPEQRSSDAQTSRRLAVSTTSALINMVPLLDELHTRMRDAVKAVEGMQAMATAIAADLKKSSTTVDDE